MRFSVVHRAERLTAINSVMLCTTDPVSIFKRPSHVLISTQTILFIFIQIPPGGHGLRPFHRGPDHGEDQRLRLPRPHLRRVLPGLRDHQGVFPVLLRHG